MPVSYLSFIDLIVAPLFLFAFYFIAVVIRNRHLVADPSYKYYVSGLMAKLFGALSICLFYVFYYGGGDTTDYFVDCVTMGRAFLKSPYQIIRLTLGGADAQNLTAFDADTGMLGFWNDHSALMVPRLTW